MRNKKINFEKVEQPMRKVYFNMQVTRKLDRLQAGLRIKSVEEK